MKYKFPLGIAVLLVTALSISCSDSAEESAQFPVVTPVQTTISSDTTAVIPLETFATISTLKPIVPNVKSEPIDHTGIKTKRFDTFIEELGSTPLKEAKEHINEIFVISGEVTKVSSNDVYTLGSESYPEYHLEFHTTDGFADCLPDQFELGQGLTIAGRLIDVGDDTLIFESAEFCGWSKTPMTEEAILSAVTFTRRTLETYYTLSFPVMSTTTQTETKPK